MEVAIGLVHNYFSSSGEQTEQHISAYKQNNPLPIVYQYFTNIAALVHSHQLPRGCAAVQGRFWKASFPKIGCDFIKFP